MRMSLVALVLGLPCLAQSALAQIPVVPKEEEIKASEKKSPGLEEVRKPWRKCFLLIE